MFWTAYRDTCSSAVETLQKVQIGCWKRTVDTGKEMQIDADLGRPEGPRVYHAAVKRLKVHDSDSIERESSNARARGHARLFSRTRILRDQIGETGGNSRDLCKFGIPSSGWPPTQRYRFAFRFRLGITVRFEYPIRTIDRSDALATCPVALQNTLDRTLEPRTRSLNQSQTPNVESSLGNRSTPATAA